MRRITAIAAVALSIVGLCALGACHRNGNSSSDSAVASDSAAGSVSLQNEQARRRLDSISRAEAADSAAATSSTVKHTNRDAAIGAAAGAIVGITTSKKKAQGAVIGGIVGGVLGGVVGNNVDKTKKKPPV